MTERWGEGGHVALKGREFQAEVLSEAKSQQRQKVAQIKLGTMVHLA